MPIYINICINTPSYTHISPIYIPKCKHSCNISICTHMHAYFFMCVICVFIFLPVYKYTYYIKYIHMYAIVYVCQYVNIYIFAYIHTYKYIH